MDFLSESFRLLTDVQGLIRWGGTLLICAIMFTETGLFIGFFLPGDSLLVTAGIFAAAGHLRLAALLFLVPLCVFVGDQVGYWVGNRAGHALYRREDSLFFKKKHLRRAHEFYEKYGGKTIVLARFVPIIRTFAPPVAGAAEMKYRRYLTFSVIGSLLWVWSMVLLGYSLGSAIPDIGRRIHIVIAVVIFLSILPGIIEVWRQRRRSKAAAEAVEPGAE